MAPAEPSTSYSVLPVRVGKGAPFLRHLYLKPHAPGAAGSALPADRALFVAGLPAALGEGDLLALFSRFGEVERAALHASRVSAVVLYAAAEGRVRALRRAAKGQALEVELAEPQGAQVLKGERAGAGDWGTRGREGRSASLRAACPQAGWRHTRLPSRGTRCCSANWTSGWRRGRQRRRRRGRRRCARRKRRGGLSCSGTR